MTGKMKSVFVLFITLVISISIYSQEKDSVIAFTAVVKVDSASKEQLYQRARAWFNDNFKSSKAVIQVDDRETGEIFGKGIIKSTVGIRVFGLHQYPAHYYFTCKVLVKDGRYKYEFSNFDNYFMASTESELKSFGVLTSSKTCPVKQMMTRQSAMDERWKSAKEMLEKDVNELISTLKTAMLSNKLADF